MTIIDRAARARAARASRPVSRGEAYYGRAGAWQRDRPYRLYTWALLVAVLALIGVILVIKLP
jgi:hypothetical protein